MIHVVAKITTKPGMRAKVLELFSEIVPLVHAEEGCIEYQPVTDASNAGPIQTKLGEDTFLVIEKWTTMECLQAHGKAAHMVEYGGKVSELLAGRTIHVLS